MTYHSCLILSGETKNHMFPQILFISFSAFKVWLGKHFHLLKKLCRNFFLLQLMPNMNPNIELSSL